MSVTHALLRLYCAALITVLLLSSVSALQNRPRLPERGALLLLPGVHVLLSFPAVEMVGEVRVATAEFAPPHKHTIARKGQK